MSLVVRGRVVTPTEVLENGWVAVRGGKIAAIGTGEAPAADVVDDRGDALVLPGAVDGQTHATSYKGLPGIADTTCSAVAGGVTTLVAGGGSLVAGVVGPLSFWLTTRPMAAASPTTATTGSA